MSKINITLPDDSVKSVPVGISAIEIASQIGPRLASAVLVAMIDDNLKDLDTQLKKDLDIQKAIDILHDPIVFENIFLPQ